NFRFSSLVLILITMVTLSTWLLSSMISFSWQFGVVFSAIVFIFITIALVIVHHGSRRANWSKWLEWSVLLEGQLVSLKMILEVVFCLPPGPEWEKPTEESIHLKPIKFIFAEIFAPSSTLSAEVSMVDLLGTLFDKVE
ncbi:unnamed protein product, partial [Meganyctiphanes norvegica]